MFAYSEHGREAALEQWLDILQSRVPGSVVLLVGTHSYSFKNEDECTEQVDRFKQGVSPCSIACWSFCDRFNLTFCCFLSNVASATLLV